MLKITKQLLCIQHINNFFKLLSLESLSSKIVGLLLGFFMATVLATVPGQTGDWGIIGASMIISCTEYISKYVYQKQFSSFRFKNYFSALNDIKIGVIYGLFVDSFKLGS